MPGTAAPGPEVESFFDAATNTISHVVTDTASGHCAIVDPVLDFDPKASRTSTGSADKIAACVRDRGLTVDWILETHVHADHLSAAVHLKRLFGGTVAIGRHICVVQDTFGRIFNEGPEFRTDGSQFDRLFADGDRFSIGSLPAYVMHTPGHTPACATYVVGTVAFVGDTIFAPDYGTARCDFPGGDARTLYRSIRRLLSLPDDTRLFLCHDYMPGGRDLRVEATVREQRAENTHVRDGVGEDVFVAMREERDSKLSMPTLILPALQVNMRAGRFPPPESNGVSYLKLPLNLI